jgi:leucyl-tRNA synthetase
MDKEAKNRKGSAKLNALLDIESQIQKKWETDKTFEENAPETKV